MLRILNLLFAFAMFSQHVNTEKHTSCAARPIGCPLREPLCCHILTLLWFQCKENPTRPPQTTTFNRSECKICHVPYTKPGKYQTTIRSKQQCGIQVLLQLQMYTHNHRIVYFGEKHCTVQKPFLLLSCWVNKREQLPQALL